MLNENASRLFHHWSESADASRSAHHSVAGAGLVDAGVETPGGLKAGLNLARLCLGDAASVTVRAAVSPRLVSTNLVEIQTDTPVQACLGAQYAGWPVQSDDFFAMGSGPMRMARGREKVLEELQLSESPPKVVGVLETEKLPDESVVAVIAEQCGVETDQVQLAAAPSTSIAGSLQVVARSVETAMHKLHELNFDVRSIVSATGSAPLPPPAKRGDVVNGIGRTNDAILYGATVTLWVDCEDESIEPIADKVPSRSSDDHGQPFAKIFKDYGYDFYKVDPLLFSPAVVVFHNLRSGRSWNAGNIEPDLLKLSFDS